MFVTNAEERVKHESPAKNHRQILVDRTDWAWEDRTDNSRVRRTVLGNRSAFVRPSPDYDEVKGAKVVAGTRRSELSRLLSFTKHNLPDPDFALLAVGDVGDVLELGVAVSPSAGHEQLFPGCPGAYLVRRSWERRCSLGWFRHPLVG